MTCCMLDQFSMCHIDGKYRSATAPLVYSFITSWKPFFNLNVDLRKFSCRQCDILIQFFPSKTHFFDGRYIIASVHQDVIFFIFFFIKSVSMSSLIIWRGLARCQQHITVSSMYTPWTKIYPDKTFR